MQNLLLDTLTSTAMLQARSTSKRDLALHFGQQTPFLPNFHPTATGASRTSQLQVNPMKSLPRNWAASGVTLRLMEPGDLHNVHPDQLHFIASDQLPSISTFANHKHLLDGCAIVDTMLTPYGDHELPYPAVAPYDSLDVQHMASEMASFSDSEDGSTGCSPGYSASELSDVFEDTDWLDNLQQSENFDTPLSMPGGEGSTYDSVEDIIETLINTDGGLGLQDLFASPSARLNMMNILQDQQIQSEEMKSQLPISSVIQPASQPVYSNPTTVVPQLQAALSMPLSLPLSLPVSYANSQQSQSTSPSSSNSRLREALMSNTTQLCTSSSSQPGSPDTNPSTAGSPYTQKSSQVKTKRRPPRPMKETSIMPPQLGASGSASLWEFILELLADAATYGQFIRWKDRNSGQFKIYDSQVVAALWGKHKNRTNMNFDKMSRAMRYYYGKNILEKGPEGGRLEYEFRPGSQWQRYVSRNLNNQNFVATNPNQFSGDERGHARVSRRRSVRAPLCSSSPY